MEAKERLTLYRRPFQDRNHRGRIRWDVEQESQVDLPEGSSRVETIGEVLGRGFHTGFA